MKFDGQHHSLVETVLTYRLHLRSLKILALFLIFGYYSIFLPYDWSSRSRDQIPSLLFVKPCTERRTTHISHQRCPTCQYFDFGESKVHAYPPFYQPAMIAPQEKGKLATIRINPRAKREMRDASPRSSTVHIVAVGI